MTMGKFPVFSRYRTSSFTEHDHSTVMLRLLHDLESMAARTDSVKIAIAAIIYLTTIIAYSYKPLTTTSIESSAIFSKLSGT